LTLPRYLLIVIFSTPSSEASALPTIVFRIVQLPSPLVSFLSFFHSSFFLRGLPLSSFPLVACWVPCNQTPFFMPILLPPVLLAYIETSSRFFLLTFPKPLLHPRHFFFFSKSFNLQKTLLWCMGWRSKIFFPSLRRRTPFSSASVTCTFPCFFPFPEGVKDFFCFMTRKVLWSSGDFGAPCSSLLASPLFPSETLVLLLISFFFLLWRDVAFCFEDVLRRLSCLSLFPFLFVAVPG